MSDGRDGERESADERRTAITEDGSEQRGDVCADDEKVQQRKCGRVSGGDAPAGRLRLGESE